MTDQQLRLDCLKLANSIAISALGKPSCPMYDVLKTADAYYEWLLKPRSIRSARDEAA